MLGCTTILWTDASQSDLAALHAALSVVDGTIEHVARAAMAARVAIRMQSGPLVVLAATDVDASIALRSGADEVIRAGELTEQLVQVTVERAALRYSARATLPVGDDAHEHGMDLLTRAFAMTLRAPLSRAESDFHALWDGLGRTMYATERLAEWGALNAPIDQLRDLAALRASAPSSNELQARVESLRTSLSRSGSVLRSFSELLVDDSGTTRVDDVAYRLIELAA